MAGIMSKTQRGLPALQQRTVSPLQEMESWIERFWGDDGKGWGTPMLSPPLDLSETADAVNLRLDLPGVEAGEIDIQVNSRQLTITGERKNEQEEKGQTFHRVERSLGRFSRSVMLPCEVQDDKVEARYQDGVLQIRLPKSPASKSRHIKVKT
jgi:HSP20 family protein